MRGLRPPRSRWNCAGESEKGNDMIETISREEKENATGDCGPVAADLLIEWDGVLDIKLCHGYPTGYGQIAGKVHWHAWVEVTEDGVVTVWDYSNGGDLEMDQAIYYGIGNIQREDVTRFTWEEARLQMVEFEHYGPWREFA